MSKLIVTDLKVKNYDFTCTVGDKKYAGDFAVYATQDECYIDDSNVYELNEDLTEVKDDALIEAIVDELQEAIQDNAYEYALDRQIAAGDAYHDAVKHGDYE